MQVQVQGLSLSYAYVRLFSRIAPSAGCALVHRGKEVLCRGLLVLVLHMQVLHMQVLHMQVLHMQVPVHVLHSLDLRMQVLLVVSP